MIKIDLVTGFLGSGKTTFIRYYVKSLLEEKLKVGIIENDFGAVNVDALLLRDLESDYCSIEQIVGGNDMRDWKRRFRAKLIAMAMEGFDRIIVEPSGIYDVDAFFDVLHDEPLDRWYEAGSVLAIVDGSGEMPHTKEEQYYMVSQISNASKIILSKCQHLSQEEIEKKIISLNQILNTFHSDRILQEKKDIVTKDWDTFEKEDYSILANGGWKKADHDKLWFQKEDFFQTEFFMECKITYKNVEKLIHTILSDEKCGNIARVKGFIPAENGKWIQFNATKDHYHETESDFGQDIFIIIGQHLDRDYMNSMLKNRSKQ